MSDIVWAALGSFVVAVLSAGVLCLLVYVVAA
jgi:hypothetical protein